MALENVAEEYFSNINSMAKRMYTDMNETKLAYEELWNKIPEKEQQQILSESIITPEVSIKYKPNENCEESKEYAVKFVIDDHCSYRDEHSGPFTFKSRSQRDLTLFTEKNVDQTVNAPPKPPPKQKPKQISIYLDDEITEFIAQNEAENSLPKTGLDFLDNW